MAEATYAPVSNRAGSRFHKKAGTGPAKNRFGFCERLIGAVFFPDR
ncbi:hypothetical protein LCAA2362_2901 [Lacticaseibacillus casei A2-362]|nr:hypothetical protein LCAA2362_2901 [Lacticaseibacillus casei A2-362]